jgi:hypothetical protein
MTHTPRRRIDVLIAPTKRQPTALRVVGAIAIVVVAASIVDLSFGVIATLVSNVFGAMRHHR